MNKEQIQELRKNLGMSQAELARELDVSWATVHRWEIGQFSPSRMAEKQLQKLVKREEKGE